MLLVFCYALPDHILVIPELDGQPSSANEHGVGTSSPRQPRPKPIDVSLMVHEPASGQLWCRAPSDAGRAQLTVIESWQGWPAPLPG